MRIAICDDMRRDTLRLKEALTRYLSAHRVDAEIDCFESGEDFIAAFVPEKYQLIFMDIYMKEGGLSGMEAAEMAYEADKNAAIVMVTTSTDYAVAGYGVAQYYIVKPVGDEALAKAMEKCRALLERYTQTIEVTVDKQPAEIRLRDIYYIESMKHHCVFISAGGKLTATDMKIDGLAEKLGGLPFVQCHRSYVVNLLYVQTIRGNDFMMKNGKAVPIARTQKAEVQKSFKKYFWDNVQREAEGLRQ